MKPSSTLRLKNNHCTNKIGFQVLEDLENVSIRESSQFMFSQRSGFPINTSKFE
jgi:hypothetical protein